MAKKIISLNIAKINLQPQLINNSEIVENINFAITKIPELYDNTSTKYAMSKATHIKYVLESLRCLETEDAKSLYDALKNKNVSYAEYEKSLRPIIEIYKSLPLNEKRLLVYTALLHDIYYKVVGAYEPEHGSIGAEYLKKHPELYQEFDLTKDEIELMLDLITSHGYAVDLGRYIFPEELKINARNKKLALLLDFLDGAGKESSEGKAVNEKHLCVMDAKLNTQLVELFDSLMQFKNKPEQFYQFRLKHLCCPVVFQELSEAEHKNILAQLDNQPDAKEIKEFLNTRLKVDDFNIFKKGLELLPTQANSLKDYTVYFMVFRILMELAKAMPGKYVRLDTKDIINGLTDITYTDIKNFLHKILSHINNSDIFTVDNSKNKIYINYKNTVHNATADTIPIYDKPFSLEDKIQQKIIQTGENINYENRTINKFSRYVLPLIDSYYVNKNFDQFKKDPLVHQQEIIPNLFIGDFASFKSMIKNNPYNIGLAIRLNQNRFDYKRPEDVKIMEIGFNIPDNNSGESWQNLSAQFPEVFKAIDEALAQNKRALISCGMGVSRSSTTLIAYLMYRFHVTFDQAFGFVYQRRPVINPMPNFVAGLKAYEKRLFSDINVKKQANYDKQFPVLYNYVS